MGLAVGICGWASHATFGLLVGFAVMMFLESILS